MAMASLKFQLHTFMVTFSGVCGGDLCQYIYMIVHIYTNTLANVVSLKLQIWNSLNSFSAHCKIISCSTHSFTIMTVLRWSHQVNIAMLHALVALL